MVHVASDRSLDNSNREPKQTNIGVADADIQNSYQVSNTPIDNSKFRISKIKTKRNSHISKT